CALASGAPVTAPVCRGPGPCRRRSLGHSRPVAREPRHRCYRNPDARLRALGGAFLAALSAPVARRDRGDGRIPRMVLGLPGCGAAANLRPEAASAYGLLERTEAFRRIGDGAHSFRG